MNRPAIRQLFVDLSLGGLDAGRETQFGSPQLGERDWDLLLDLAKRHEVAALLRIGLNSANFDAPPRISAALAQIARACEVRSMLALEQLEEALSAFESARIEVVILKGALFAAHYYPSPGLRPFGDIDLLVRRADLERAARVMEGLGCEAYQGKDGRGQAWWTEHHNHWIFKKPAGVPIELHWALSPPRSTVQFDEESLWRESERVSGSPCARRLSDADLLLHIAVHAVKHQLALPLRNFVDAAAVIQATGFSEWPQLMARAGAVGADRDIAAYLLTARELGFVRLPSAASDDFLRALGPKLSPAALAKYAVEWPLLELPHALVQASGGGSILRKLTAIRASLATPASKTTENPAPAPESQGRLLRRLKKAWRLPQSAGDVRTATAIHEIFSEREAP